MVTDATRIERGGGLRTAVDMIVAPRDAFARLRERPTWVWAYVIATGLAVIGALLMVPALRHAMATGMPSQLAAMPEIAKLPADEQQKRIGSMVALSLAVLNFTWLLPLIILPVTALVQTLVMLLANMISGGDGTFRRFWSLALNVQIAGSIGGMIVAFIVLLRGPDSFGQTDDLQGLVPSLALLAPGAPHGLVTFLGGINLTGLWQSALLALGMITIARVSGRVAWITSILMLLALGTFAALYSTAQHHTA